MSKRPNNKRPVENPTPEQYLQLRKVRADLVQALETLDLQFTTVWWAIDGAIRCLDRRYPEVKELL